MSYTPGDFSIKGVVVAIQLAYINLALAQRIRNVDVVASNFLVICAIATICEVREEIVARLNP